MNKYIEWVSFEGPGQPSPYTNYQQALDTGAYRLMDAQAWPVAVTRTPPRQALDHRYAEFPLDGCCLMR